VPLPPIVIVSVLFLLVKTNCPLLLMEAVTLALVGRSMLIALIKLAIVSVPVDVYRVVLMPALTLMVPFGSIPSVDSDVLAVIRAVPIPVAGVATGAETDELELGDGVVELLDEDVELPEGSSRLCIAAESWVLTRVSASPLAMLARPFAKLVSAWPITLMSEASAVEA